ncbi:MAG: beta-galactosidase trimerization domain-containing protein [Clostridia bacterium]
MTDRLRFRQIHLDFHTSELIEDIGKDFDPEEFAATLVKAHVNSITCFARCHHGMIYYDSQADPERVHPHLVEKDLLKKQIAACHKNNIKVPVYTTVQWDEYTALRHPEWLVRKPDGTLEGEYFTKPGFYQRICVNTPYIDFLKKHVTEFVSELDCDGVFFDIVSELDCSCTYCLASMKKMGLNPLKEEDRKLHARIVMNRFKKEMSDLVWSIKPGILVFFNSGHVSFKDKVPSKDTYSHFEIESLPSGGWGYAHFPVTVRYTRNLGKDYLAHTGKFHTSWGDFHSFKNPEALQYEVFRMLALNSKCLVGDQLEPCGRLSLPVYDLIGKVYEQVEKKEPWCANAKPVTEIGVLVPTDEKSRVSSSQAAIENILDQLSYQFDFIDEEMDFSRYRLLIIPERVTIGKEFENKLGKYLDNGGKVIAVYDALFDRLDIKVINETTDDDGEPVKGKFMPRNGFADYIIPNDIIGKSLYKTEYVMYVKGLETKAVKGTVLVNAYSSLFNRSYYHFSSHAQAPSSHKVEYDAIVLNSKKNAIYFSHPIFEIYNKKGPKWIKEILKDAIGLLMKGTKLISHDGPSTVLTTINHQPDMKRYVVHILNYIPERRCTDIDLIEDIIPLYDLKMNVRLPEDITCIRIVPEEKDIKFRTSGKGVSFRIDKVKGHCMVELGYK